MNKKRARNHIPGIITFINLFLGFIAVINIFLEKISVSIGLS